MARQCTLKGNPLALEGPELKIGDKAPDAVLRKSLVDSIRMKDTTGSVRVVSVVPSLDTPVCAQQTKRFNDEMGKLKNVKFITVSCDLPMAQARFCGAEGIDKEKFIQLSDHKDKDFGKKYGTLISDLGVECRAVFVLDKDDTIKHVEYVPEIADHPNYDAIINCAKTIA